MSSERHISFASRLEPVFNGFVGLLARAGVSLKGTRLLAVRGRTSGEWRTNPVNLLTFGGERYLVAPLGGTQWVRNIRVAGGGELRLGRSVEAFTVTEIEDEDKPPVLREYFRLWAFEVAQFFDRPIKNATDEDLTAISPGVPVFRINR